MSACVVVLGGKGWGARGQKQGGDSGVRMVGRCRQGQQTGFSPNR